MNVEASICLCESARMDRYSQAPQVKEMSFQTVPWARVKIDVLAGWFSSEPLSCACSWLSSPCLHIVFPLYPSVSQFALLTTPVILDVDPP